MPVKVNWDLMGIAASVACAIHCAVLPVVISTLPVFGINIIHNSFFEWGMIALAFAVGCYSLLHGYIRHHKNYIPITVFSAGALFLVLKQFFASYEYLFLSFAVFFYNFFSSYQFQVLPAEQSLKFPFFSIVNYKGYKAAYKPYIKNIIANARLIFEESKIECDAYCSVDE